MQIKIKMSNKSDKDQILSEMYECLLNKNKKTCSMFYYNSIQDEVYPNDKITNTFKKILNRNKQELLDCHIKFEENEINPPTGTCYDIYKVIVNKK